MTDSQNVHYRHGQVRFRLPKSWIAEKEANGDGIFYDPKIEGGLLRLSVLTFDSPHHVSPQDAINLLASSGRNEGREILGLKNGNALVRYREEVEDEDGAMVLNFWEVAGPLLPDHLRLAVFSYAIPESRLTDREVVDIIRTLEEEIFRCEFAPELVAGE
ncbi:MAG TPA: hypothetical protein VFG65_01905 [Fimbriimonadales bacterium]|jgi:hypothetical protein|nr:hypothetical protein [Fimbriimonadales bacterium]